jgi:hypothetical protein
VPFVAECEILPDFYTTDLLNGVSESLAAYPDNRVIELCECLGNAIVSVRGCAAPSRFEEVMYEATSLSEISHMDLHIIDAVGHRAFKRALSAKGRQEPFTSNDVLQLSSYLFTTWRRMTTDGPPSFKPEEVPGDREYGKSGS